MVLTFAMQLTFDKALTSYFYATPIQTFIDKGPELLE